MSTGTYALRRFTAPSGGVVKGTAYLIGSLLVVARSNADAAALFTAAAGGKWTLPKTTSQAWTEGQQLYWNDSTKKLTSVGSDGILAGVAAAVAGSSDATGAVLLNGIAPGGTEGAQPVIAALTDNSGGATADGTIGVITIPTALTGAGGGTANGALEDELTLSTAGGNTYSDSAVNTVIAKLKNNIAELAASQTANITALTAARDSVKELSTEINALLAAAKTAGWIASS